MRISLMYKFPLALLLILVAYLPALYASPMETLELNWEGPTEVSLCEIGVFKIWIDNQYSSIRKATLSIQIPEDLEYMNGTARCDFFGKDDVCEPEAVSDRVLTWKVSALSSGAYRLELQLRPKAGAKAEKKSLVANFTFGTLADSGMITKEKQFTFDLIQPSFQLSGGYLLLTEKADAVYLNWQALIENLGKKADFIHIQFNKSENQLTVTGQCGGYVISKQLTIPKVKVEKDPTNPTRLQVILLPPKDFIGGRLTLGITMGASRIEKDIEHGAIILKDFESLFGESPGKGELEICLDGITQEVPIKYCKVYNVTAKPPEVITGFPYLIIIRGIKPNSSLNLIGSPYLMLSNGDTYFMFLYQDLLIPSYHNVTVSVASFDVITSWEIVVVGGKRVETVFGGLGTLVTVLITSIVFITRFKKGTRVQEEPIDFG